MGGCISKPKSTNPGECIICYSDSVDEYCMWPCGHGNICLPCTEALSAESVGGVVVRNSLGHSLYFATNQTQLRCPACRSDGFHHRIFRL